MGILDRLSYLVSFVYTKRKLRQLRSLKRRKRRPLQTVNIKVKMDCDGCERKVRHAVKSIRGVTSVNVDRKNSKVTVTGYVDAGIVVKRIRRTGKIAEPWPYVPYNLASYPYVAGVYDKRAPSGFVRNAPQAFPSPNATVEKYTWIFNDDNANACSIM